MPKTRLRSRLLRLAAQSPNLRERLIGMLKASGGLTRQEEKVIRANTNVIQQAPIVVQQAPIVITNGNPDDAPTSPLLKPWGMPAAPSTVSPNLTQSQMPEEVQAPPAFGVMLVTERTQRGFESDLVPEMERLLASGMTRLQVGEEVLLLLATSFSKKDMLYNILIRHQSTFESDDAYRQSLERLVGAWTNSTANSGV
ncbi:hypothetical protein N9917_00915 [Deltaproteobacteria bacterium]|nr:hypothetical protein [Deltaproteobacteria bacterium]